METKELPKIILSEIERDATTGLVMKEKYISISHDSPIDEMISKASKLIDWKVRK